MKLIAQWRALQKVHPQSKVTATKVYKGNKKDILERVLAVLSDRESKSLRLKLLISTIISLALMPFKKGLKKIN
jgi:hypothetical protein